MACVADDDPLAGAPALYRFEESRHFRRALKTALVRLLAALHEMAAAQRNTRAARSVGGFPGNFGSFGGRTMNFSRIASDLR
jgi:hypothetical protein